jgi:DNA helicase-2/ATP-dependent DNA helicase PcrA
MINPASPCQSVVEKVPLNAIQRDAVLYDGGPQLVFAGAGTGKTRVLTAKIAHLIESRQILPHNIFAATFTNKAAQEMRTRIESLVGISCSSLWIGTFHSMCARILRREAGKLGYSASFTIYDDGDQVSCVKKALAELNLDERSMPPRQVLSSISHYKNRCIPPDELNEAQEPFFRREIIRVYRVYSRMLKQQQAMDFDDLIANVVYLFRKHPPVLEAYQRLFQFVLVDEYQDTNVAQFYLVKFLAQAHNRIFAVGDDDQGIYGWRGANIENILSFEKSFPGTRIFTLEQNYRSVQSILSFAHAVIVENTKRAPKKLWTSRTGAHALTVTRYRDDRHEADSVGDEIKSLFAKGTKPSQICVLFRTNAQSRAFEEAFRKKQIPYVLVGTLSFYERKEIKDCLAFLRLLVNPLDNVSFERIMNVPPRGLGDKAYDTLSSIAAEKAVSLLQAVMTLDLTALGGRAQKGLGELRSLFKELSEMSNAGIAPNDILNEMLTISGYMDSLQNEESEESEDRIENINQLVNTLTIWSEENQGKTLTDFLQEVSLMSDVDRWQSKDTAVNCMTMHCAKGLEFKAVFLVGLEDGLIPSKLNFEDEEKMAEERRLMYVGITRAMDLLYCSYAEMRWRFGSITPMMPSRFLSDIPNDLFEYHDKTAISFAPAVREQRPVYRQERPRETRSDIPAYGEREIFSQETVDFRMGQQVIHKIYGRGRIVNVSGFGKDLRLTILFNDGVRRKLMGSYAGLEQA